MDFWCNRIYRCFVTCVRPESEPVAGTFQMTINHHDETSSDDVYTAEEQLEVVRRYIGSGEMVSEAELKAHLQPTAPSTIVDVSPSAIDIVVTVQRPSAESDEPLRECYTVRPTTRDGKATLQWSYLGPVIK